MTFLRKAESNCDVLFFPIAKLILLLGAATLAYIPNAFGKRRM